MATTAALTVEHLCVKPQRRRAAPGHAAANTARALFPAAIAHRPALAASQARQPFLGIDVPRRPAAAGRVRRQCEPMCSMLSTRRPRLCTIWTAVAPEAVFTRRTNTPTPRGYPPRHPF
jgi:hypothetical protein